jgi:hypothetical protein
MKIKITLKYAEASRTLMTTVSLFLSVTLILIISFVLIKKKNHLLVLVFVLLVTEYLITSFVSVIVDNENLWKVSKDPWDFFIFRVTEVVIFPLLLLLYLEMMERFHAISTRMLISSMWIVLLVGIERLLINLDIMKYVQWEQWASFLTWFLFLYITNLLKRTFNRLLHKEGIKI